MKRFLHLFFSLTPIMSIAQDSTRVLEEVTVSAFQYGKAIQDVPLSVGIISTQQFERFQNTSLVSAVNTLPGIRMEERSPGSYRFSIRGSLLRSPFGIRNVKFYWNGLPLTDGGGNTYLNLLDVSNLSSMEIIKGPGASVYGAGTGGVVLLHNDDSKPIGMEVQAGSYGLFRIRTGGELIENEKHQVKFNSSWQQADGYREHSAMKRFNASVDWSRFFTSSRVLSVSFLTSDLFYETPGGLTKAQFKENPRQARPTTPTGSGAVEKQASISNTTNYLFVQFEDEWRNNVLFKTGLVASLTDFKNRAILNVEERREYNTVGRTEIVWNTNVSKVKTRLNMGAEYQFFHSPLDVYDNNQGTAGARQTKDVLGSFSGLVFLQSEIEFPKNFHVTAGGSLNMLQYTFERTYPILQEQRKIFSPAFYPRIALLKKIKNISMFTSISRGFSPPTWAEVLPSEGIYNGTLKAEQGINIEMGAKGIVKKFNYELSLYQFTLRDAIVIQRTETGADYFVNAGKTIQQGAELFLSYSSQRLLNTWVSYSLNNYHFNDYVKDDVNFSDNRLTGVSPNNVSAGIDFVFQHGFYIRTTASYVDHLPLNDANSEYASEYWLLSTRIGYQLTNPNYKLDFFIAGDNLLNETYSLGNDLNAQGGRYYNAAAGRNFTAGLKWQRK